MYNTYLLMAEQKKKGAAKDLYTPQESVEKKYIFRLLESRRYKTLPAMSLVFDEETKRQRQIRLIEGVDTFWKDEQDARKMDNDIAMNQAWRPEFVEDFMILTSPLDDMKIQYMQLLDGYDLKKTRINRGKPPLFTLENREGKDGDELELMRQEKAATDKAFAAIESGDNSYIAHAKYMGVSFRDGYGNVKFPAAIQKAYVAAAKANPKAFLDSFNSPKVQLSFLISTAIDRGVIDLNHMRGQAHWGHTKAYITVLDASLTPEESLVDFATTEEGEEFVQTLKLQLEGK